VDDIDLKILRVLQKEHGLPINEIGERVGLSHTPCWRRIKKMEELGIIRNRAVILDANLLDLGVTVFVFVRLKQHHEEALIGFERAVLDFKEIVQCYSMTGEFDYLIRVVTTGVSSYEDFVKNKLLHLPDVAFVNSSFALQEVKNTTELPI
jgi:Lrp/AsnC family transcriptional regulator